MGGRSEFFLQPLESRRFLSGAAATPSPEHGAAEVTHASARAVEEQVAQLKKAMSEMADRMAQFEKLLDGSGS